MAGERKCTVTGREIEGGSGSQCLRFCAQGGLFGYCGAVPVTVLVLTVDRLRIRWRDNIFVKVGVVIDRKDPLPFQCTLWTFIFEIFLCFYTLSTIATAF